MKTINQILRPPQLWRRVTTWLVIILSTLNIAGWGFNVQIIIKPFQYLVSMNPTSSLCFILSAISLELLVNKYNERFKRKIVILFAIVVFCIGFLKLGGLVVGIDIPVDSLIFFNEMKLDFFGNRMAPNTSLGFLIAGIGLLFLNSRKNKLNIFSQYLALIIGTIGILSLLGYLYDTRAFYVYAGYTPMSLQTATCFLLLAIAILFIHTDKGFMVEFFGNRPGAILARKLIPAIIIVPTLLGILRIYITKKGYVSMGMGTSLNVLTYILIFLVLLILITYELNRKDTIRRATEDALRNSWQQLSEFKNELQNQSQAISRTNATIEFDLEGNILYANENFLHLFGYTLNEIKGKHHRILLSKEEAKSNEYQHFWDDLKKGVFHKGEFERKTKDDQIIWILGSYNMITNVKGDLVKVLKIVTDISDRKKLETEIKQFNQDLQKKVKEKTEEIIEQEKKFRFILQNMREGIQIIGYDFRYLFVNNSAAVQSKYLIENLLGHTMMEKYPGIENNEMFSTLRECMRERYAQIIENEFTFPNGEKEWYELSIQPVPEGLLILSIDITNRRKGEEQLRENAEELKTSNKELERFAYIASHDLQEPLRMVSSFLNLLENRIKDVLDETSKQYIYFAVDGAGRMKTLIQDLLTYSRIGTNMGDFNSVDLNEVLQYITKMLEENIRETQAVVTAKPLPVISANKSLITQLFANLITNALKYRGGNNPVIEIGCNEFPVSWNFYVKDNGMGIDPKFFEKIFIIFQRLHNKSEFSGTGIGLAICKKIVEIHKGKIWVESSPDEGSTFYFSILKTKNKK